MLYDLMGWVWLYDGGTIQTMPNYCQTNPLLTEKTLRDKNILIVRQILIDKWLKML